ncbi:MAG: hypothetical protein RIQ54_236 [Candidatus Parcubacteria bacterium]|jgi:spermidine synthase
MSLIHRDRLKSNENRFSDFSYMIDEVLMQRTSPFQEIAVVQTPAFGRALLLDGVTQITEKDEFIYHEMLVHVPVSYTSVLNHVAVIGGGDGCAMREVEKYQEIKSSTLCEIDPNVISIVREYFGNILENTFTDPRLSIIHEPAQKWIESQIAGSYDLIINDSLEYEPGDALSEELYGEEHLKNIYTALADSGVYATLAVDVSPGAANNVNQELLATIKERIERVFDSAFVHFFPAVSYGWSFMTLIVAIKNPALMPPKIDEIWNRWKKRGIDTRFYSPFFHVASLIDPSKNYKSLYDMNMD